MQIKPITNDDSDSSECLFLNELIYKFWTAFQMNWGDNVFFSFEAEFPLL